MNTQSLYQDEDKNILTTTRYIFVKVRNVFWIVNRVSSLFRRRRYNMLEFSVDFNSDNTSNFLIVVDWETHDIDQIISQIEKIYDVLEVYDVTENKEMLYYTYFVDSKRDDFWTYKPYKKIKIWERYKFLFNLNITEKQSFQDFLVKNNYKFKERITPLF